MVLTRVLIAAALAETPSAPTAPPSSAAAPPSSAAAPPWVAVHLGAADGLGFTLPERINLAATVGRGPFWGELGGAVGVPQGGAPDLDRLLVTIAWNGDRDTDFTRVWTKDRWALNLGVGAGDPQRVARRAVGSPFVWLGAEARDAVHTEIVYDEAAGYRVVGIESGVEVGPLLRAGFLVGIGEHVGVRLAVEDRIRPERNLTNDLRNDTALAVDLSWRF